MSYGAEFFRKYADIITEAEKVEEDVREKEVGAKEKSSTGGTIEKTEKGIKHTAGKKYGGKEDDGAKDKDELDETVGIMGHSETGEFGRPDKTGRAGHQEWRNKIAADAKAARAAGNMNTRNSRVNVPNSSDQLRVYNRNDVKK